jgi:hypothetical protein
MIYDNLKKCVYSVKDHSDLSYKSIPFFEKTILEIKVELLKVSNHQGEQVARNVTDAIRHIAITEREDLSGIQNYPREIPKYLGRVKTTILLYLAFVDN